ncbi:MAG: 50S ribosomal protein L11 methyltransferase [Methylocystaceae bacterium]
MKWIEISVVTKDSAVEIVTGLLYNLGCNGVVVEDPEMARRCIARGEWDFYELPSGFLERDYVVVIAYFPEPGPDPDQIRDNLAEVLRDNGEEFEVLVGTVDESDWANLWKAFYHTLRIGKRLVVKPTWEEYQAETDDLVIELDPEMAFGTGTHSTTRFCMQLLESHLQPGMRVWDIGTGSGILSITAAKLGAGPITALDIDPVAVRTARANIEQNQLLQRIEVREMDFLAATPETGEANMVVANIIAAVIKQMAEKVWEILPDNGLFLVSGIIVSQWDGLLEYLERWFIPVDVLQDDSWVGAVLRKKGE